MTVRVGKIHFYDWKSLELPGGWSDTLILRMSPLDGLPPGDYTWAVRPLVPPLLRLRKTASLWVQVEAEGMWFVQEVRYSFRGLRIPVAVTVGDSRPKIWEFSFFPWLDNHPISSPPKTKSYLTENELSPSELCCLRVLARADCAYTAEIASLTGLSLTTARKALQGLEGRKLVELRTGGRYSFWKIRRLGLSLALRSWGLAPGMSFPRRKERGLPACKERGKAVTNKKDSVAPKRRRSSAGRHRGTARLWPAWLRRAWPWAEIWSGWSEVPCGRSRPDALCWGQLSGQETLFWLEVESGNASRVELRQRALRRINRALVYARRFQVKLVFAVLGPLWVRQAVVNVFRDLPSDVAVVLEDWKDIGTLPVPEWGKTGWR